MKQEIINSDYEMRLVAVRNVQSAAWEELSALLPRVLDKAFKGEL